MNRQNIIIGGGITGMYLAYQLCKNNEKVMVLERNKRTGGLLEGFEISGNSLEKTYHHLFSSDKKAVALIKELGLEKNMDWYKSSMAIYYGNKLYPFCGAIDLLKFDALSLPNRIRTGVVSLYLSKSNAWHRFEKIPAYEYMKRLYGQESYKVIWQPLLKSKFGEKYKKVSMAWMWARLNSRGNSKENGVEKLGYLMGGFGKIVDRLSEEIIEMGGIIRTNVLVSKIDSKNNQLTVSYDNKKINADRIFCCIDNDNFSKLIDAKKHKNYVNKLKSIDYIGTINLVFSSKQELTSYYWNNINDSHSPFVSFVNHTQLVGRKKYKKNNIYYLGTYIDTKDVLYKKSDESIKKIYFDYLKKIIPSFDKNKVIQSNVFKYDKAQHLVDTSYTKKILPTKTELNNVYLINYSQIYPKDRGINWSIDQIDRLIMQIK